MLLLPESNINLMDGTLSGSNIIESLTTIKNLQGVFEDEPQRKEMDQNTIVYKVQAHFNEKENVTGGLFFGTSFIYPGMVGDEYFMTRGHFHLKADRAEYYWCIQGQGVLILMDLNRNCRAEKMFPGSLHYIPGYMAHRLANTGGEVLIVGACWPSDAGHDYQTIASRGFFARLKKVGSLPELVEVG